MSTYGRFLVLILTALISAYDEFPGEEACPKGWIMNVENNRCYYISDSAVKYPAAKGRCAGMSAHLTTDATKSERSFLRSALFQYKATCGLTSKCSNFWIGLHLSAKYWSWPDGTLATDTNWFPEYPSPNSKCGLMSVDAVSIGWKNENCEASMKFICKAYCPNGFVYDAEANSCYQIIPDKYSWEESARRCSALHGGATLAIILSPGEINAVTRYINNEVKKESTLCFDFIFQANFWIGARRESSADCNKLYLWSTYNGSVGMEYSNWNDGEPNCNVEGEMCVHTALVYDNKWIEGYCNSARCSLCELRLNDLL